MSPWHISGILYEYPQVTTWLPLILVEPYSQCTHVLGSSRCAFEQKRALNIIFPFMSYEDALKKSGLINLCQRREDACVTFLKRSYYSSDLLRNLVPRCQFSRPYALRAGRTVSVPTSSRSIRFGNFCTIKYQNHV